jgi:hypothetical protein
MVAEIQYGFKSRLFMLFHMHSVIILTEIIDQGKNCDSIQNGGLKHFQVIAKR